MRISWRLEKEIVVSVYPIIYFQHRCAPRAHVEQHGVAYTEQRRMLFLKRARAISI